MMQRNEHRAKLCNKRCHVQLARYKVNSKLTEFMANAEETGHVHKIEISQ